MKYHYTRTLVFIPNRICKMIGRTEYRDGTYVTTGAMPLIARISGASIPVYDNKLDRMIHCSSNLVEGRPIQEDDELSIHFIPMQKLPHAKVYSMPINEPKYGNTSPTFTNSSNLDMIQKSPIQSQRSSLNTQNNMNVALPPMMQSPSSKVLNRSIDNTKSIKSISTDKCIELAKETAQNPEAWNALWESPLFCNIFTKLMNSRSLSQYKSNYNIQELMQYDPLYVEDNVLIDVIVLAMKEQEQVRAQVYIVILLLLYLLFICNL